MNSAPVLMLVCESGRRWLDTARRFAGPYQTARVQTDLGKSPVIAAQACEITRVRARLSGEPSVVVLWEITQTSASQVALVIAQIGVGRPDVLQLVALDRSVAMMNPNMNLRLMELSAAGVVQTPEQFPLFARLIRRQFS